MEKLCEKGRFEAMTVSENADNIAGETSNRANTSSSDETNQTTENRKRKEREGSSSEPLNDSEDESSVRKKKRVIWTSEMHRKFVDAIAQIGEDRAFPKKIVEVMNEPGLTRENVASHLQKYRICLKKSQEERYRYFQGSNAATENSKTPYIYKSSLGNYQQYSQLASNSYLPISTSSIHSSLYGIRTGIGASRVRLAPPSYSSFDISSLPAVNTGNLNNQYSRRTEANKDFQDYGDEDRNILLSTFNKRPCSNSSYDHATSSSTSNSAFMGLRIANDGKSLLFGGLDRSEIVLTENYSTKRNDLHYQESKAPLFPSFNNESYAQDSPLPPFPDSEDHLEESSLPPFPEFYVENAYPEWETEENEFINLIPQQETYYGTSRTVDKNSFSSGHTGTSLDQQNSLQSLASEILENTEMEQNTQIFANNQTVTSLPPITSPWNPNTNMTSYPLIDQEVSLPPLPSEIPWNLYPNSTISNPTPQIMNQHSLLPPSPSESLWNVNPDASTMPVMSNNIMDQEHLLPCSPSEIPWNLDSDPVPQIYNGNFFGEQNTLSSFVSDQTPDSAVQNLSSFHVNIW